MFELTQILYYIGCTLGTLLIGSPAVLLLHRDGAKIFHPKSWFMGTTIIMLLCYWMSMFGIPMKQAWLIVAALSLIVWIIVWKRRLKGKDSLFVEKQTRGLQQTKPPPPPPLLTPPVNPVSEGKNGLVFT